MADNKYTDISFQVIQQITRTNLTDSEMLGVMSFSLALLVKLLRPEMSSDLMGQIIQRAMKDAEDIIALDIDVQDAIAEYHLELHGFGKDDS